MDLHGLINQQNNTASSTDMEVDSSSSSSSRKESVKEKRKRYRERPMDECSDREYWMALNHFETDPTSTSGDASMEPILDDSVALADISDHRNPALDHARNLLAAAEARSNQEEIWFWEERIDYFTFM